MAARLNSPSSLLLITASNAENQAQAQVRTAASALAQAQASLRTLLRRRASGVKGLNKSIAAARTAKNIAEQNHTCATRYLEALQARRARRERQDAPLVDPDPALAAAPSPPEQQNTGGNATEQPTPATRRTSTEALDLEWVAYINGSPNQMGATVEVLAKLTSRLNSTPHRQPHLTTAHALQLLLQRSTLHTVGSHGWLMPSCPTWQPLA